MKPFHPLNISCFTSHSLFSIIDWSWSADKVKRFVDATGYPYDNAKAYINGEIVKFIDVEIVADVVVEHRARHIGKVIFIKNGEPVVVCSDGLIGLKEIRDKLSYKYK